MNFGYRNELRHYNERKRQERIDSIVAKTAALLLAVVIVWQIAEKLA